MDRNLARTFAEYHLADLAVELRDWQQTGVAREPGRLYELAKLLGGPEALRDAEHLVLVTSLKFSQNAPKPLSVAEQNGRTYLVNDTNLGGWTLALWVCTPEWSGWAYEEEPLADSIPEGPKPTHFMPEIFLPPAPAMPVPAVTAAQPEFIGF